MFWNFNLQHKFLLLNCGQIDNFVSVNGHESKCIYKDFKQNNYSGKCLSTYLDYFNKLIQKRREVISSV